MSDSPVVLITGTRTGIGAYLVRHFLNNSFLVEGCSRQEPEWSENNYVHHVVDVANEKEVRQMLSSIRKRHKRLDVLINNAGIASMNHVLLTPADTVDRIFKTNFRGTFLLCRESAKLMKERLFGRIVNLGTVAVPMRLEGESLYAASKSAITTLTQILAFELAEFGITLNVLAPTPIETDLIRSVPKEKINRIISSLAIKRLGKFEDVSNVIDFFIRKESDYITGQVIYLGGVG